MPFGYELRESSFQFGEEVLNLNHGSYGACPTEVLNARLEGIKKELAFPDEFYRLEHEKVTDRAREILAKELDAPLKSVVCVPNATAGVSIALNTYTGPDYKPQYVVFFSTIYGNCKNILRQLRTKFKWRLCEIPVPLDISDPHTLVEKLEHELAKISDRNNAIALFETVTSMPSIRFPWEDMVAVCQKYEVMSVVDGAHGIGLIPISLSRVRPDYFVTNAHKWFYSSHSVAVLYVDAAWYDTTDSSPVGVVYRDAGVDKTWEWHRMFNNVGTSDRSALYAIPAAATFREEVLGGTAKAMAYQNELSFNASRYLCEAWNTTEVANFGKEYRTALFTLRCPYQPENKAGFVAFAYEHMMKKHNTLVPLFVYEDTILLRFSAAVYVDIDDFKQGKRIIDETISEWERLQEDPSLILDADETPPVEPDH